MKYIQALTLCICLTLLACTNPTIKRGYGQTPEELGQAIVEALNAKSEENLHNLRVDKEQYEKELWPEFPSSRPELNFTPEFAWGNMNKKCLQGVSKWIRIHGGKDYEFVRIQFTSPTQPYKTFKLRRGALLTVRTLEGKEQDLKLLGSVVEKDNYYRLLSYDD
jgi:hypothetical protein